MIADLAPRNEFHLFGPFRIGRAVWSKVVWRGYRVDLPEHPLKMRRRAGDLTPWLSSGSWREKLVWVWLSDLWS
jgi:hypothetical protein